MNQETQVAPVAETQNTAPEITDANPAPVDPASSDTPAPESEKAKEDRRIERLERRLQKQHSEKAYAQAEADQLRQRLAQFEQQRPQQRVEVDPRDIERHIETLADQKAAARDFDRACNDIVSRGTKAFPDFDASVKTVASEIPLFARAGGPTEFMEAVMDSENPPALLAYLGKNPDVLADLADLTPRQQARKLMRLEGEITKPVTRSQAPEPLEVEKPRTQRTSGEPDAERNPAAWIKWRNQKR